MGQIRKVVVVVVVVVVAAAAAVIIVVMPLPSVGIIVPKTSIING